MSEHKHVDLDVELLTDVSLSTSNRTLGEPDTFTCIPGRTLWGAAAGRMYRGDLTEEEAFRIFHQGTVRICDAVPLDGEHRAWPVPRSWQYPKHGSTGEASNFASAEARRRAEGTQHKPCGEGWMIATSEGKARRVEVHTARSMRTAIDPSGRSRDGLLFGIPVIEAGARFVTRVSGPTADVERVVTALCREAVRLGRSRNQEMGLARVRRHKGRIDGLATATPAAGQISFLCASRCLLRDPSTGTPTCVPYAEAFRLGEGWVYDEAASAIRTTRIVHFNGKRNRPETDRYAIERGSVITFRHPHQVKADVATLVKELAQGVGEHRGEGYGEVEVSPAWLVIDRIPIVDEAESPAGEVLGDPRKALAGDQLFGWASKRALDRIMMVTLFEKANQAARELRRHRVPPSQWGVLRTVAREAQFRKSGSSLLDELFREPEWRETRDRTRHQHKELAREGGLLLSGRRALSREWKSARGPLITCCEPFNGDQLPMFLEMLASACMREELETEVGS